MVGMGIKPIDYQMMVPKTSETVKIQNELNQKGYINQSQIAMNNRHEIERSLEKVNSTDKTDKAVIREKKGGRNQYEPSKKKKDSESSHKEEKNTDKSEKQKKSVGSIIDITV